MAGIRVVIKTLLLLALPSLVSAQFKYWDVENDSTIPALISGTGFYANINAAKKVVVANAYHFDVLSPLWSDAAHKTRWVIVPDKKSIIFDEKSDYWKYPDSTVFVKLFAIDTIPGDSTSRVLWETRFLVNKKIQVPDSTPTTFHLVDKWYAVTYRWNRNQKDAVLVGSDGLDTTLRVYPNGKNAAFVDKKWRFPSRSECSRCHILGFNQPIHGRSVLGFFTAQLNRPHPDSVGINQLEHFFKKGILTGTKPTNWDAPTVPRWASIDDAKATVDVRARSYIAANCSGCHGARGLVYGAVFGPDINYDFHAMTPQMELRYLSTTYGYGMDNEQPLFYNKTTDSLANPRRLSELFITPAVTVPGYPGKSVLLFRQLDRNTAPNDFGVGSAKAMPPLGSYEVNVPATNLIARWILEMVQMDQSPAGIHSAHERSLFKTPIIQGRLLRLPAELAKNSPVKVFLTGISGRTLELIQVGAGSYSIPANLSAGIYLIRIGSQSFTRYLF